MTYKTILVYLTHPHVEAWNFKVEHKSLLQLRIPDTAVHICSNSREFKVQLPEGFQRSEFLLEHGAIDMIIHRKDLQSKIHKLLMVLLDKN